MIALSPFFWQYCLLRIICLYQNKQAATTINDNVNNQLVQDPVLNKVVYERCFGFGWSFFSESAEDSASASVRQKLSFGQSSLTKDFGQLLNFHSILHFFEENSIDIFLKNCFLSLLLENLVNTSTIYRKNWLMLRLNRSFWVTYT